METVRCSSCGEENPARFRLCGFCGTSLAPAPDTVTCPSCGEENPARFRLCGFCGTALAGASPPVGASAAPVQVPPAAPAAGTSAPPAPALPAQEVRKLVTLVFSDLKDSTALTASIDAEAMNEIKARYFGSMAAEIERHGGKVEKNIGDAIMAVFGLVRAREDDALRAVRAAAGMQATLAKLNEELQRFYGVTITNRTGVNTGEIVANTDPSATQNLATGDAVNVAARLEQNAPANEILIGEMTHELVRDHVEVEPLELQLKGKAEPVPAFRLLAVRTGPVVAAAPADAPFIGREFEMDLLAGAFAEVGRTSSSRLLTVVGDAGVGKTRLIADFLKRVSGEATVLRGRCLAYGDGITFWPLVEIVRAAARIGEDDSPEVALRKVDGLVADAGEDRAAIVDRVASAIGLAAGTFPVAELFWGARRLLETQAATRPLVVVIDDIHDAEETFLDLLAHVVGSAREAPILILCSARPELLDEQREWTEQPNAERIDLKPLDEGDVVTMIDRLLGDAHLPAETREKVIAAAEGNPLYVEQMVSMVRDRLHAADGAEAAAVEIVVPPTIHALLAARLDHLTREERAIVDPASVIGLVFPEPAIEELVPDALRPRVPDHLSDLDRKQFVHPLPGGDDPAFRFHHILVRDAAYQSLLKRARATLHERFVEWAERVNRERDREIEFEEILGYHLEQAVRYRSELGPLDATGHELAERAMRKLASAGRRAFARGDTPAACSLLRRAAALIQADGGARVEILTELADALMEEGGFDEAATVLDDAAATADRLDDEKSRARASLGRHTLALHKASLAGFEPIIAEAERAGAIFASAGDLAGQARALRLLMLIHGTAGAYDRATAAAHEVVEVARAVGDARLASRGAVGYAVSALHGPTPATEALRVCEGLAVDVRGDRKAEAIINGVLAQLLAMRGEFGTARERAARALRSLLELGPSVTAASTSIESSRIEILAGDPAAAEASLRRDYEALEALGENYYRASIAGLLAHALADQRRYEDAERFATVAAEIGDEDDAEVQILWRSAQARVLAARGETAAAVELSRRAVATAETTVDLILQADALASLAEVLTAAGDAAGAERARDAALDLYDKKESRAGRARLSDQRIEASPSIS